MKILVTGAAGFIGANFVYHELLMHPDYKIVGLDSLTYAGNLETLDGAIKNDNFKFIKADITDIERIDGIFATENFDIVVNFAAESHVDRSIEDASVFLNTNIIGTQKLMDVARKYGIARFHQVSTDEVYGDLPLNRPDLLFTEETPIHTSSPYSASKASADLLVQAYIRTFDFPATISRCSNNYGPYQFPEKLIPLMISNALADKPLPVYGEGLNVRDWLYVEDHCKAIDLILAKGKVGEVYNIGGHNEMRNIDIVKLILRQLGKPESLITFVNDRKGHDMRYAIDPTKISTELGWLPETAFADGIVKTIDWYLKNKEWWGNMSLEKETVAQDIVNKLSSAGYLVIESNTDKPWGAYFRIDDSQTEKFIEEYFPELSFTDIIGDFAGAPLTPKILLHEPAQRNSWQYHNKRREYWKFITPGKYHKSMTDDQGDVREAAAGELVVFEIAERHRLVGADDGVTIVAEIWQHINAEDLSDEDDIKRLDDDYDRGEK
jgi:dTDP-glucose 4,6-dehydratase